MAGGARAMTCFLVDGETKPSINGSGSENYLLKRLTKPKPDGGSIEPTFGCQPLRRAGNMKSAKLIFAACVLSAVLALPGGLTAQHTRYQLIDIPPFARPQRHINPHIK